MSTKSNSIKAFDLRRRQRVTWSGTGVGCGGRGS